MDMEYANNGTYVRKMGYQVTYIDRHPDSTIPDKILDLPLCKHDRFFTADNLNHDVFTLFFQNGELNGSTYVGYRWRKGL